MRVKFKTIKVGEKFQVGATIYERIDPDKAKLSSCCESKVNAVGINRPRYWYFKDNDTVRTVEE